MKALIVANLLMLPLYALAQQQSGNVVSLEINERTAFVEVNNRYELLDDTIYHANSGFLIFSDYDIVKIDTEQYVIIKYPDFKNGILFGQSIRQKSGEKRNSSVHAELVGKSPDGKRIFINGKVLAMKKSEFDLLDKTSHYDINPWKKRNYQASFGLLTVPFKLRPKIDSTEFNLTTDISLGPYVGITKRISRRHRYYMTVPATLGLSFININDNNTSDVAMEKSISVVPGISWSSGLIFQLNDFNIGFVFGRDYASGLGTKWKYHSQTWYSFAIGYNFISQK